MLFGTYTIILWYYRYYRNIIIKVRTIGHTAFTLVTEYRVTCAYFKEPCALINTVKTTRMYLNLSCLKRSCRFRSNDKTHSVSSNELTYMENTVTSYECINFAAFVKSVGRNLNMWNHSKTKKNNLYIYWYLLCILFIFKWSF